jgi:hypothetical protein
MRMPLTLTPRASEGPTANPSLARRVSMGPPRALVRHAIVSRSSLSELGAGRRHGLVSFDLRPPPPRSSRTSGVASARGETNPDACPAGLSRFFEGTRVDPRSYTGADRPRGPAPADRSADRPRGRRAPRVYNPQQSFRPSIERAGSRTNANEYCAKRVRLTIERRKTSGVAR